MRGSIATTVCLCAVMCLSDVVGFAATNATITLQGRLTNALTGEPLPDGLHPGTIAIQRTDNGQFVQAFPNFVTKDGFFTLDVSGLPIELFECNEGATDCLQVVAMTVDGQAFPDVVMTNAGRSATTSRVDGDIHTSPSQIAIPASDEFNPQTATISDGGMNFTDNNGAPVFNVDTKLTPGHPERTFDVDALTTFLGLTKVRGPFRVDPNDDGNQDLLADFVNGVKVSSLPFTVDPSGSGEAAFNVDPSGNVTMEGLFDGFPDFKVLSTGVINGYASEFWLDRNHDFTPDFWAKSNGSFSLNTDFTGGDDATFGPTAFQFNKGLTINPSGIGVAQIRLGDPSATVSFDLDQDNSAELIATVNDVTIAANLNVDLNGSAFGENLNVASTGLFYKVDGASGNTSMRVTGTQTSIDPNQDGTSELTVTGGKTEIRGDLSLLCTGCSASEPSFAVDGNSVNIDADHDGSPELIVENGTTTALGFAALCTGCTADAPSIAVASDNVAIDGDHDGTNEITASNGLTEIAGLAALCGTCGTSEYSMAVASNEVYIDGNHDGTHELACGDAQVTVTGNWDVNCDDAPAFASVRAEIGLVAMDADQDGTRELEIVGGDVTITGDLNVTGGTKNFVQPHPTDPTKEIVYVSLEAGEAGTYTRGSGRLSEGVARISLPEHFRLVTNEAGLTAQITPRGPVRSMLYVESVTPAELVVRASDISDTDVAFDYLINGVRLGYENHEVIRDRPGYASSR